MKSLRVMVCGTALLLSGCSTLSNVPWSAANPWNWFGSSLEVTEQGVGDLSGTTPLEESAITDALGSDYRVRSGMKTDNGNIVRYFEALKDDQLALVVNGDTTVRRVEVLDKDVPTESGVSIGTPFTDLYDKAYGNCQSASDTQSKSVSCKAPGSEHIHYLFSGPWSGPEGLMPPDDVLKRWSVERIIWQR
ncbi:RpoE-regulated lipoprotein [Siccibacter turicensis]|uniref:RpoE-regulated lipoprotein n=1 Tax=Siccibacter turicensis TaxID=357233 RepID=UPI003F57A494